MTARKRTPYFCGIDVAKQKHVACVIDPDDHFLVRSQSFNNDAAGFACLRARLNEVGGPRQVAVAMEATGHYWHSLHDFLIREGYDVAVLNPIQTAQQAKKGIRKRKTDKIELICPHRKNRKRPALQDGRKLRRYRRRWIIERMIAWFRNLRRLAVQWDRHINIYRALFHLAYIRIRIRQFWNRF